MGIELCGKSMWKDGLESGPILNDKLTHLGGEYSGLVYGRGHEFWRWSARILGGRDTESEGDRPHESCKGRGLARALLGRMRLVCLLGRQCRTPRSFRLFEDDGHDAPDRALPSQPFGNRDCADAFGDGPTDIEEPLVIGLSERNYASGLCQFAGHVHLRR
jgi:hypothetical protein